MTIQGIQPPARDWFKRHYRDSFFWRASGGAEARDLVLRMLTDEVRRAQPDWSDAEVDEYVGDLVYLGVYRPNEYGAVTTLRRKIWADAEASKPPPPPEPGRARKGRVRAQGRVLVDDEGPFVGVGISLFWAAWAYQHDRTRLDRAIDYALGCGCNYARILASCDWTHLGHTAPVDAFDSATTEATIGYLGDRGLRSLVTLFTRRSLVGASAEMLVDRWAGHFRPGADLRWVSRILAVEIANESDHPGNGWDDDEVRALTRRFRDRSGGAVLVAPSARHGDESHERLGPLYQGTRASLTTIHYPRYRTTKEGIWRPVRQPRHTAHDTGAWPVPIVDNEHIRYDQLGHHVAASAGAIATAIICGCGASCHHDRPGVWTDVEYHSQPNADRLQKAIRCVVDNLPADVATWRRLRTGQDGFPFPSLLSQHWAFDGHHGYKHEAPGSGRGMSRAFAAVKGDQVAMILTGVRQHVALRESQPRPFRAWDLATGTQVYEGRGPVTLQGDDTAILVVTE